MMSIHVCNSKTKWIFICINNARAPYIIIQNNLPIYIYSFIANTMDNNGSFKWSQKSTKLLVDLYDERKHKFKDPSIRKKMLWAQILEEFERHGICGIDEDFLDRKMRNMKKTFRTIRDNIKQNPTGRGKVSWEYYEIFEEIFADDAKNIDKRPIIPLAPNMPSSSNNTINVSLKSQPSTEPGKIRQKALHDIRKKMVMAEENRIAAVNRLARSIEKNNKIHEERNLIMHDFFQHLRNTQK